LASSVATVSPCSVNPPQVGSCTSPNEFGITSVGVGSTVATITGNGGKTLQLPITVTAIDLHVSIVQCSGCFGQFNGPLSASLSYVDATGKTVTIQGLGPKNLLPQASYGDFVYYNAFPVNQIALLPVNATITISLQGILLITYSASTTATIQPGKLNVVQASLTY
jgi:hypothetical protein